MELDCIFYTKVSLPPEIATYYSNSSSQLESSPDFPNATFKLTKSIPKIREEGVEIFQHEPDEVFEHIDAQHPGVVIEVSFTQKKKDLARLADSYILGSEENIYVVVGLDIEYKTSSKDQSRRATISLWRPKHNVTGRAEMELVAEQSVTDLICLPTNYNSTSSTNNRRNFATKPPANPSLQAGLRLQLCHFAIEVNR